MLAVHSIPSHASPIQRSETYCKKSAKKYNKTSLRNGMDVLLSQKSNTLSVILAINDNLNTKWNKKEKVHLFCNIYFFKYIRKQVLYTVFSAKN